MKSGAVNGIFVDRNMQSRGVGKVLADAALSHFQKEGCKTCYVLVDRFNSPSWNMFLHRGFTPFEFNEQFRVYGWKIFSLWRVTSYLFCPGCFILRKTTEEEPAAREIGEGWHFLVAWLGFSLLVWVVADAPLLGFTLFGLSILGVVGVSIFIHELSHKLMARFFGLRTVFKVWESGLIFSALLALLGSFYPCHGSTFIRQKDWPYNKDVKKLGLIYMVGPIASLILASCFLGLIHWANTGWLISLGMLGFWVNFIIVLFNLIPIFPFTPFDGRKIFLGNKTIWSLLVIGFILLVRAKIFL